MEHGLPIHPVAGLRHLIVQVSGVWDPFGNVGSMGSNTGGNDPLLDISGIWQTKMFGRGDIT